MGFKIVFAPDVFRISNVLSGDNAESKIHAGATIHRKIKMFMPCIP